MIRGFALMVFLTCLVFSQLIGQEKQIVFEQITNESGRSLGFITGIVQDQTGFMWFGTRKGLYRYNGYSYKLFKHDNRDSLSLPFNDIAWLYYDHNQNFWMRHYDELGVFKNEKANFEYDTITNKHFDIEAIVVQDIKGNYWVGPTGKGLIRYQPAKNKLTNYACPLQSYGKKTWHWLDSLVTKQTNLVQIIDPRDGIDTLVSFTISHSGNYLVISSGESDKHGVYDFGFLQQKGKNIWQLSSEKSMWAGGQDKNRIEVNVMYLEKGNYSLGYISDNSYSCKDWLIDTPDKMKFCGTAIYPVSEADTKLLKTQLLKEEKPDTYLVSNQVKSILNDNDGNIWVLTNLGLEKFDYKKEIFEHYEIPFEKLLGFSISPSEYLILYQDKKGIFWIGSQHGLIRYDHLWGRFLVFQNKNQNKIFTSDTIYSLFEDHSGMLWIGTNNGINIYDKERNTVEKITANNKNRLYDNRIIQIFEDQSNNIWVATFEGLNRLIKSPFTYTNLGIEASSEFPAYYDQGANIWYAFGNEIIKYSRTLTTSQRFELPDKLFNKDESTGKRDYVINDMVIAPDNNVWLAIDNKICRYNLLTQKVDYTYQVNGVVVGNDSLKNQVKKLILGNGHEMYAICPNSIIAINNNSVKITGKYNFPIDYDFIEDVDMNYYKSALKDKTGNIWIRTSGGIYLFNPRMLKLELVSEFSAAIKRGPGSAGRLDEDAQGNIWYATMPELHRITADNHADSLWKCNFEHDWGTANVKIGQDRVYIYAANGLYTFDRATSAFDYFSVEDGFIDNNLNGLEEDKLGYIWLTSLKGLTKFDITENSCLNFFTSSDVNSRKFLGNPQSFKIPTGEFVLFTTDGFISFYPDSINGQIPKVVVDKFTIRGKEVNIPDLLDEKQQVVLSYKQNFIGFEFSVLDFTAPQLNKFKYMLEGHDEEWNLTDANNRKANYSGLSPGKYKFKVIGCNNDKTWNTEGETISIIITPPWYKTIAAYISYVILIVTAIWLYIRIRERKLKEEKHILEIKVKERTAEIEAQKEELAAQNEKIAQQHKDITDSIHYAQRIQRALLPKDEPLKEVLDDYFILYRPRDIVSGDYYWLTRHENYTVIVAADCTGHGVPGAFMSMLGVAFLNEIINKEGILEPDQILNRLRENVMKSLHQTGADGESKDGMDISMYVIDHNTNILKFSGAYNPLYIMRNGEESITLKGDRMPIGYHIKKDTPFATEVFQLQKGDCLYNSSDGYPDQFGGEDGRKFMSKNFRELLQEIHTLPMCEQRDILNRRFDEWRGEIEQIDDVIVFGVRI